MRIEAELFLLLGLGLPACGGPSGATVPVSVRHVLADEDFDVVSSHPSLAPHVAELHPSHTSGGDGAGLLSLVIAPPGSAGFTVGDEGPCLLIAAAGVGVQAYRQLPPERPEVEVRFEVSVNGERVFEHATKLVRRPDPTGTEWAWLGGSRETGLMLARGDEVVLSTRVADGGAEFVPELPLPVGFAIVELARPREIRIPPPTPKRPNIVVVVQDTQRRDRLTPYGYARDVSPNLARVAERGTVFDNAYSTSSWTWPSTASLLTGMLPAQHGVHSDRSCYLDRRLRVLPEALREAGYRTAGFSGSRIVLPGKGFDQGFQRFDSFRGTFRKSADLVPLALDWMREHADERFFCYLHLVDTHGPHLFGEEARARFAPGAPEDWEPALFQEYTQLLRTGSGRRADGTLDPSLVVPAAHAEHLSALYDASVFEGDRWLGEIVSTLEELGLDDRTVVVFTSDHGEELFDHGKLEHGHTLHGELVRVPLVIAGPGVPADARVDTPVSNRHIAPTLARLAGAEFGGAPDGMDLLGVLRERPVIFSTDHGVWRDGKREMVRGMRSGQWLLHSRWTGPDDRLFDLARDPGELEDVSSANAEHARALRVELGSYTAGLEALRSNPGREADEDTLETLRDIGYLESVEDQ